MRPVDLIIMNFKEVRRRSIKVWTAIPEDKLDWQPDSKAMTCKEMIRHVLEGEYLYYQILKDHGSAHSNNPYNPFESKEFTTVNDELEFSHKYREEFLDFIRSLKNDDLTNINIDRSDVGYVRSLGDMLLRIAYHESVHTGQMLDYLRTANIERPLIWD